YPPRPRVPVQFVGGSSWPSGSPYEIVLTPSKVKPRASVDPLSTQRSADPATAFHAPYPSRTCPRPLVDASGSLPLIRIPITTALSGSNQRAGTSMKTNELWTSVTCPAAFAGGTC